MLRYGLVLVIVAAALLLSLLFEPFVPHAFLFLFLAAVVAGGWFGRTGPGLLSAAVSVIVVEYFFIAPYRAFAMTLEEVPYILSFMLSAGAASWVGATRRSAEEQRRAHLNELFEQAPEAIMLVNPADRVLRVNHAFSILFGFSSKEIVGGLGMSFIVPPDRQPEVLRSRERLAQGERVRVETVRRRKDGSVLHVAEVAVPIVVEGRPIAYYVMFHDMTAAMNAAEALQKSQAELAHLSRVTAMGELVASIAHEVNQPIAAVVTNGSAAARWLAQQPPNLEEADAALDRIIRDASRAGAVIERIRGLITKNPPQMLPVDINEVIRSVLVLTDDEIRRGGVALKTDLADVPHIIGDPVQLQQVFLNLILNGIEAMATIAGRPRELLIRSALTEHGVSVQVQDSGIGMKEQQADVIFQPFYTTKADGLGMGLAVSRSIIEAHGGRLWATSGTSDGTVMTFHIPKAESAL